MATVCDVAKYVLQQLGETTSMKLEKLVYYCQAWSLVWDGVPLFEEDFEAWANGPVCPQLFRVHQGLFLIDASLFCDLPDYEFSELETETMDAVLDYYGDKSAQWLNELTHLEIPWREARKGIPAGERCDVVISKESMQEYYGGIG